MEYDNNSYNENNLIILQSITSSKFHNPNNIVIAVFAENNNINDTNNDTNNETNNETYNNGELKIFCETQLHLNYSNGYTFIQFASN